MKSLFRRIAAGSSALAIGLFQSAAVLTLLFVTSSSALAAPVSVFSDGFGTVVANDVPDWPEDDGPGAATRIRIPGTGNESASPQGDAFALIDGGAGWLCRSVDATGYEALQLSYYWRGDQQAENPWDDGVVEYKIGGSCTDVFGWNELKRHDLRNDSVWTTQAAFDLPASLDDNSFSLRFRTGLLTANDEDLRLDGVELTGEEIIVDTDSDTIPDEEDNCPLEANEDQADADADGEGDVCDEIDNSNIIVVRPSDMQGWLFNSDETANPVNGTMVSGPDVAPLGTGSARLPLVSISDHQVLSLVGYQGTRLADISALEYSTYRTSGGDALAIALQFNIDSDLTDLNTGWQGRLIYEPYHTQTVSTGVWQTWNVLSDSAGTGTGNWWFSNGTLDDTCSQANPCTWGEVLSAFPNAGVHATLGMVHLKSGSGWNGFDGTVDRLRIVTDSSATIYDFEPDLAPTTGDFLLKKYACPVGTVLTREANGPDAEGEFTVPAGCTPQAGVYLGYTYQSDKTDNSGPYLGTGAGELFTSTATDSNGEIVLSGLSSTGRYNIAETDANGNWLNPKPEDLMALYCYGDAGGGDDNYDITFVPADGTTSCVVYNEAPVYTVSGTKFNDLDGDGVRDEGEPGLAGWTIYTAEQKGVFMFPASGPSVLVNSLYAGKTYLFRVSGTYDAGDGIIADARYSERNSSGVWTDSVQNYESEGPELLDLQMEGASLDWGSFNPDHVYWYKFVADDLNKTFTINDTFPGNNSGSLRFTVFEIHDEVLTDAEGNYTLEVPQGYNQAMMVTEAQQPGWKQTFPVSPVGEYTDYGVHFTHWDGQNYTAKDFGNHQVPVVIMPETVTVTIHKYIDDEKATAENADSTSFPMASSWDAENLPAGSGTYTLDLANGYQATTSEMTSGADYATNEVIDGATVGADCTTGEPYALEGYTVGDTLEEAESAPLSMTSPSLSNITTDKVIIVWNRTCGDIDSEEPTESEFAKVHIYKYLDDGKNQTQVPDDSTLAPFPMTASWDAPNLTAGTGNYVLGDQHGGAAFKYAADTIAMETPVTSYGTYERTSDLDPTSQVLPVDTDCVQGKFRLVGYKSGTSLEAAQSAELTSTPPTYTNFSTDQYLIVVNENCDTLEEEQPEEPEPEICVEDTVEVEAAANSLTGGTALATGTMLEAGDHLAISVAVDDTWSAGADDRTSNANGLIAGNLFGGNYGDYIDPVSSQAFPYGALVGKIGTGPYFLVGTGFDGAVTESGELQFLYWDSIHTDNSGSVTATINVNCPEETSSSITIKKEANPADGTDFAFSTDFDFADGRTNFSLDDNGDQGDEDGVGSEMIFPDLDGGSYSFTEEELSGWSLDDITCDTEFFVKNLATRTLTVQVGDDEDVICTFWNAAGQNGGDDEGDLLLSKSATPLSVVSGETVTYTLRVENTMDAPQSFDLDDLMSSGLNGGTLTINPTSVDVEFTPAGGTFTGTYPNFHVEALPADATVQITYEALASDTGIPTNEESSFFNTVTLTLGSDDADKLKVISAGTLTANASVTVRGPTTGNGNTSDSNGGGGRTRRAGATSGGNLASDEETGQLTADDGGEPETELTRGFAACMMMDMLGQDLSTVVVPAVIYVDVRKTHEYADCIKRAKELGVMVGYGDGRFRPDQKITRAEALITLYRALNIAYTPGIPMPACTDLEPFAWYRLPIRQGVHDEVISVSADNKCFPNKVINRGQFNQFIAALQA